jgi:hypothetical protein
MYINVFMYICISFVLSHRYLYVLFSFSFNKGIRAAYDENKEAITEEIVAFIPFLQIANHDDNYG